MSQGFAGLWWNRSKMPKSPPIAQQNTNSPWPSPHRKQKQEQDTDWSQSMSVWCRFSSCKRFLFIEERAHTEPRKMKGWIPQPLQHCSPWISLPSEGLSTSDTSREAQGSELCQGTEDALKEGSLSLRASCSAPTSCLPSAHCWCNRGRAALMLLLIWGGLFCFIFSNSLCKMFPNKLFLYYLLEAISEHTGRVWCISVGIHSSPPAWSEILPNTHTEGCWLLRLCSTFTALAVLKFN